MAKTKPPAKKQEAQKPEDKKPVDPLELYPVPPRMGRPPTKREFLEHNIKAFEHIMQMKPALEWVAAHFFCDAETISRFVKDKWGCTFVELRQQKLNRWRSALFNVTMDEAINKRNTAVLIFANKNILKWENQPERDPEQQEDIDLEFFDPNDPPPKEGA